MNESLLGAVDPTAPAVPKKVPAKVPAKKAAAKVPAKKVVAKVPAKVPAKASAKVPAKKVPAKKVAARAPNGGKGSGQFFFDPDEREALGKKLAKITKAMTSKELAEKFETETFKIRLAGKDQVEAKLIKGSLVGNSYVFGPR